jgi:ferredoxin--NADP+ reductase
MMNATLIRRINVTPDLMILRVKPDAGIPDFKPGQYVALGLPGEAPRPDTYPPEESPPAADKIIKRAYSIGSSPTEREFLEFYVAVVPTGALTSRLVCLKEGDRLFCAPKITGHFTLDPIPGDSDLLFVATGTGLAPFTSMMGSSNTWEGSRRITLLHGVRHAADLGYQEEIAGWRQQYGDRLSYIPFTSRGEPPAGGRRGHVTSYFTEPSTDCSTERHHVLLCGNPAMIDSVEALLTEQGFVVHSKKTPGNLHFEKYW